MAHAIQQMQSQGWQVLPWDVSGEGTNYLRQVEVSGSWISQWTTVYPGSTVERHDGAAESAWWALLIEEGKIAGPPIYILESMREAVDGSIARHRDSGRAKDGARIKRMEAALVAIDAALKVAA